MRLDRKRMLLELAQGSFDLLVIGEGITGAGVAREASLRGLRVGMVEKRDIGSGTSSRSTRLVHGGLRYLRTGGFRLVREAVVERQRLMAMAPGLVVAKSFVFPVFRGDPDPLWRLRVGLTIYDWLAASARATGGPAAAHQPHRVLTPEGILELEPLLAKDGPSGKLAGGALYTDCLTDDARMTLAVLGSAVGHGAVAANYCEAVEFLKGSDGKIRGLRAVDVLTGADFEIRAGRVLAAAGPWGDEIRRLDDRSVEPVLRLTKGVHAAVPFERLPLRGAAVMRGRDGRIMFVIPNGGHTYAGTTDTDYCGGPDSPRAERSDIEYILETLNRTFPGAGLTPDDVVSTWAGLRPLVRPEGNLDPSATSRDYQLFFSPSGLVSVAGGKLTAFRAMAANIVDRLFPATRDDRHLARSLEALPGCLEEEGDLKLRLGRAVREEMAVRLEDFLRRRSQLMLFGPGNGRAMVDGLAWEMGGMLGWTDGRVREEAACCRAMIDEMFEWKNEKARGGESACQKLGSKGQGSVTKP